MGAIENELVYGLTIRESADDGSDFTNPAADYRRLFLGEDGQLHVKDSAGAVTDIGGSSTTVATDAIWDAAGDLAIGTGANTAGKLTKGAAGTVPTAGASTLAYAFPPGYEFSYVEVTTADTSITATTESSSDTIITADAVVFDGATTVYVEFWVGEVVTSASDYMLVGLWDGATQLGRLAFLAAAHDHGPLFLRSPKLTPSGASHTYSIRAKQQGGGTGHFYAGAGGTATAFPMAIRVVKA